MLASARGLDTLFAPTSSTISTHSQRKRGYPCNLSPSLAGRRFTAAYDPPPQKTAYCRCWLPPCCAVPPAACGPCRPWPMSPPAWRCCNPWVPRPNGRGVTCSLPPAKTCKGRFPTTSPGPCAARCSIWRRCSAGWARCACRCPVAASWAPVPSTSTWPGWRPWVPRWNWRASP